MIPIMKSVALRGCAKLATLLNNLMHRASQRSDRKEPDRRTEYAKRSRGKGKRGRGMQHIGRVRGVRAKARGRGKKKGATGGNRGEKPPKAATSFGYVDIWAALVLLGKGFLPLARQLFSNNHPRLKSQNRVEEAVLFQALGVLGRLGYEAIAIGDRGLGRKELVIKLAKTGQELVFRIDPDITAIVPETKDEAILSELLAKAPYLGEVIWDRGEEGRIRCQVRKVRATIRFSRSGRKNDYREATVNFLELVPMEEGLESLVLVTTLPVESLVEARGIARVYSQRWAIETGFETMHGWGQDRFMVRSFQAIDRLLWIVALAHVLVVLALRDGKLAAFRAQAKRLLRLQAVLGRRLTVGKLVEAIGLDFARHRRAWAAAWLL